MSPVSHLTSNSRRQPSWPRRLFAAATLCGLLAACGCSHFRPHSETQYVYVTAKQAPLRDRLAAVSNRVGQVNNGDKLQVLESARDGRFLRVKTPSGVVGWLQATQTANQALADEFEALRQQHLHSPIVASATTTNDAYLHILPGLDTDRFYRLSEGDPMSLLERATVPKPVSPGAAVANAARAASPANPAAPPPPPPMDDFWLVRGPHGETGWIYSHMVDINVPDAIARYAECRRIIGAYVLATVDDPEAANQKSSSKKAAAENQDTAPTTQPVTNIPEYVTVVNSGKAGLPYDFDEVRVFIWNIKKHRYETSFRERNIMGYLPVKLFKSKDPYGKGPDAQQQLPTFSYTVLAADTPVPAPDPKTGELKPAKLVTKTYRLEGNICRRLLPPNTPAPDVAHPTPEPKKEKAAKGKRKH